MQADDPRLAEAKAKPIKDVAFNLGLTWLVRGYPEIHGYCPKCGGSEKRGSDRFWIDVAKNSFGCRKCATGGDQVALIRFVRECGFVEALDWLCGPKPEKPETEAERKKRIEKEGADRSKADARAEKERQKVIADARRLWEQGQRPEGTAVEDYLRRRSIDMAALGGFARCVRFHPDLPYAEWILPPGETKGHWQTVHRGPAMICAVQNAAGRFSALHRTYLDLGQPKGKALILHPQTGEALEAKKGLGSKKGGAIRLSGSRVSDTLIMAEGIETTLSAWMAIPGSDAMFWAGIDLGNMGGRQQRGQGLKYAGLPDLDDDRAFLPPVGVTRLVFVMDGDSEPRATRATLEAGLRRAMLARPGLRGQIARAPDGKDLNDVLMGVG